MLDCVWVRVVACLQPAGVRGQVSFCALVNSQKSPPFNNMKALHTVTPLLESSPLSKHLGLFSSSLLFYLYFIREIDNRLEFVNNSILFHHAI